MDKTHGMKAPTQHLQLSSEFNALQGGPVKLLVCWGGERWYSKKIVVLKVLWISKY